MSNSRKVLTNFIIQSQTHQVFLLSKHWRVDMLFRNSWALFFCIGFLFSSSLFLQGQSTYGTVAGTVTDPSGAALADVQVTLTNQGTAEKRIQSTNGAGEYSFVNVIPGNYSLDIDKTGFKHLTRQPIQVQVQQSTRIDAALQIGSDTQTVEVSSETPLLQAETSSLGQVVEERKG